MLQALRKSNVWPQICQTLVVRGLCENSAPALKELVDRNAQIGSKLWLELSLAYDISSLFHRVATFFEGSGFLAPFVFNKCRF